MSSSLPDELAASAMYISAQLQYVRLYDEFPDEEEISEFMASKEFVSSLSDSVEKSGNVREEFRHEFNSRFARMMQEFVRKDTFEAYDTGGVIGYAFYFHLKGASKKEKQSSVLVHYPEGNKPHKTMDVDIKLPSVMPEFEERVRTIVEQVTFSDNYYLKFRPSKVSDNVVPSIRFNRVKPSVFSQNVRSFGKLFELVHSPKYPSVESNEVIDPGDVLESDETVGQLGRTIPRDEWEPVTGLEDLSNGDYVVVGHGDGADIEGIARIVEADSLKGEVEMVVESFRTGEQRNPTVDVEFNPYKFQYRADPSVVDEESSPEVVSEEYPIEENVQTVFEELSIEVMELENQIEEEVDFEGGRQKISGRSVEDEFEGTLDDVDLEDDEFVRLSTSQAIQIRSIINSVIPANNPAGDIWSAMKGAKSSASGRDGRRVDALAKEVFGASGDVYGDDTVDDYDFSPAEKKAFAMYAKASQIVMEELYGEDYELYRGVSSYGASTFARSFFRNPQAEEFSIKETAVANYSLNERVGDTFAYQGLKLADDDPLVINANDILRGYYSSSAAPNESEIWLPGGDQTLSPEQIDVTKEYDSFERRSRSLDEFVGQEIEEMTEDAVEALAPHAKALLRRVDDGTLSISRQTATNLLRFIQRAELFESVEFDNYDEIRDRVLSQAKADFEPTIDLTTEEAVDWIAETRETGKSYVKSVHEAPDGVVVRVDENGLFYRAPRIGEAPPEPSVTMTERADTVEFRAPEFSEPYELPKPISYDAVRELLSAVWSQHGASIANSILRNLIENFDVAVDVVSSLFLSQDGDPDVSSLGQSQASSGSRSGSTVSRSVFDTGVPSGTSDSRSQSTASKSVFMPKAPEGVPEYADYIAPTEQVPEGWESTQTEYGGTYAWDPDREPVEAPKPDSLERWETVEPVPENISPDELEGEDIVVGGEVVRVNRYDEYSEEFQIVEAQSGYASNSDGTMVSPSTLESKVDGVVDREPDPSDLNSDERRLAANVVGNGVLSGAGGTVESDWYKYGQVLDRMSDDELEEAVKDVTTTLAREYPPALQSGEAPLELLMGEELELPEFNMLDTTADPQSLACLTSRMEPEDLVRVVDEVADELQSGEFDEVIGVGGASAAKATQFGALYNAAVTFAPSEEARQEIVDRHSLDDWDYQASENHSTQMVMADDYQSFKEAWIRGWALQGDTMTASLSQMALQEFGANENVDVVPWTHGRPIGDADLESVTQKFRQMYENTQRELSGEDSQQLYRGVSSRVTTNGAVESWTEREDIAEEFDDFILEAEVDPEDVLGTWETFGDDWPEDKVIGKEEWIVLGGGFQ